MNQIIIDGCVQKNTNLMSDIASFNISAKTGVFKLVNNNDKNRFTYIRVIYPYEITSDIQELLIAGNMVRIYGKLDSEQYETDKGKIVYNKIICAEKIVKIRFNKEIDQYEEVI